ncbi:hypothetical protein BG015_008494 [Linnemannia schmuckeri]|uniref:Uncharacterized protein n=1 Tax=Linnemannia schmuckeri TaxID=64567 RepID=A0A9P5S7C8_9FUNG|nr:hypothetical protein BG015_008494 [Linnemannia schmuckeri]
MKIATILAILATITLATPTHTAPAASPSDPLPLTELSPLMVSILSRVVKYIHRGFKAFVKAMSRSFATCAPSATSSPAVCVNDSIDLWAAQNDGPSLRFQIS